jgi:hypothetical protein
MTGGRERFDCWFIGFLESAAPLLVDFVASVFRNHFPFPSEAHKRKQGRHRIWRSDCALIALAIALWHAIRREFAQHREWMIRGYAIGLAVAAIRPIMAMFFATALLHGHRPVPHEFFGTAFWIGFTLQMMAAEIWINYTRPGARAQMALSPAE